MAGEREGSDGGGPGGPEPIDLETDRHVQPDPEALDEPELPPRPDRGPDVTADGHTVAPDPDSGDMVGPYRLGALLGRGGAGSVFRAKTPDGQIVAVKVLAASKVKRARVVQRFFDEVRAASLVAHDGLIRIVDFVEEEEPRRLAYVMEYVEGEMLRAALKRETALDLRLAIQIGVQMCEALEALHGGGIVHRDLKPENILLTQSPPGQPPRVKLLDFGVVKFLPVDRTQGHPAGDSKPGTFVGTPRYMAPEQAAGAPVDGRADLFSVGVMLFEMITGRCPHEGDSLRDVVLAKLKGAPRITMNPEKEILPQELTDVVDACLQLKPSLRPEQASSVGNALREAETVLFTVGAIRAGEGGAPVRDPTAVPALGRGPDSLPPGARTPSPERGTPRPTVSGTGRGAVTVTAASGGRNQVSITASHPGTPAPSAPEGVSASGAHPAPAEPPDEGRRLIMVLLGLVMVAAALMIALAARRFMEPEEAELVTPLETNPPAQVERDAGRVEKPSWVPTSSTSTAGAD